MDRLEEMITAQHELQQFVKMDPLTYTGEERIQYIKDMILACTDELHEALAETGWKRWATSRHVNEQKAFDELRDAWQFLTNAMLAVAQRTPDELALMLHSRLLDKIIINKERETSGYDGVTGKCPGCKRDLAEVELNETYKFVNHGDGSQSTRVMLSCMCGVYVGSRAV